MKYIAAALAVPLFIVVLALASSDSSSAQSTGTSRASFHQCINIGAAFQEGPECSHEVLVETTNTLATLHNSGTRLTLNIVDRHLEANNAYTVWWIIFNDPSGCIDGCGGADIVTEFGAADVILMHGAGGVSTHLGNLVISAWIDSTGASSGSGEVLIGDPATIDIANAEIHAAVRTHGPASTDAAILAKQLGSFTGGCTVGDPDGDALFPCFDAHAFVFGD